MSQGGCFKFKSGCSRPSEEIFRDLAEILTWNSESPDVYPKIKKEGRKNIWKYIIELQRPFYPGEISALRTDRFCGDVSGDFTRWCSQGNLLPEISKPWDIGHLELFGTWVGPVAAFCDIYIYIVFGYSIWPVCAVMSKWALAIFPFTNKSSRVGVEHWPGVIYSIQKYVYILLTLRFIKGCCSRGSNFPISLLCVMCFPHLHPSNW